MQLIIAIILILIIAIAPVIYFIWAIKQLTKDETCDDTNEVVERMLDNSSSVYINDIFNPGQI